MAWTTNIATGSLIASATIRDGLNNAIAMNIGGTSPDALKLALYDVTATPSQDTDPMEYNVAPWASGEVTGTNWPAGGVALAGNALTLLAGTGIKFTATNVSVASTTIATGAYGCLIYDTQTGLANRVICAVYFGGTGYTTNNGTFGITWNASGIFTVTLH